MTPRPHTLAPSLSVPVAAPSKLSAESAPSKTDESSATTKSPVIAATAPGEASEAGAAAKGATDIVASCEDESAPGASSVGETIPPTSDKVAILPSELQAAIDRCMAVRDRPGSFIGWGERSEETAAAALDLVAMMTKDYEALRAVRNTVNQERKKRGERAQQIDRHGASGRLLV